MTNLPAPGLVPRGGARLHLSPTTAPRNSVRGKQLSRAEEEVLLDISQAQRHLGRFSNHSKRFWMHIADLFADASGRSYSWQSCRRRMLAWEEENDPTSTSPIQPPRNMPFDQPPQRNVPVEPLAEEVMRDTLSPLSDVPTPTPPEISGDDTTEDDFLPETPIRPLRRHQAYTNHDPGLDSVRGDVCAFIRTGLDTFESQLQLFTSTLAEEQQDCYDIQRAFDNLRNEVQKGIESHLHSRA